MNYNPYNHELFLYIDNGEDSTLGDYMRNNGDDLEKFVVGEDLEMRAVSSDGVGPPDGWVFQSWVTQAQSIAFVNELPNMPASTVIQTHAQGEGPTFDAWLASLNLEFVEE